MSDCGSRAINLDAASFANKAVRINGKDRHIAHSIAESLAPQDGLDPILGAWYGYACASSPERRCEIM